MVVLIAAGAATAHGVPDPGSAAGALIHGIWNNKVLWLCLGVGLWHLTRAPVAALGVRGLFAAGPALVLSAAGGSWPWLGLAPVLLWAWLALVDDESRRGLLIVLLAGAHEIIVGLAGEICGDTLLGVDAWLSSALAAWFLPGLLAQGNALQLSEGHMLVLVWGCGSLSNLGDALLLFCALVSLYRPAATPGPGRGRVLCCMLLLMLSTIALNAVRLGLMASGKDAYAYLHGGDGATWFRVVSLGATAALSLIAAWR